MAHWWTVLWANHGDLWFLSVGFYLLEWGGLSRALRQAQATYSRSLLLMRSPRAGATAGQGPGEPVAPMGLHELAEFCAEHHEVIPADYFQQLFAVGADYEQSFKGDLSYFVLVLKGYLGGLRFLALVLSSCVMVALLLGLLSLALPNGMWNFRGMIVAMLVVQGAYVVYAKYQLMAEMSKDLAGGRLLLCPGGFRWLDLPQMLRVAGLMLKYDRGWFRLQLREYWRQRSEMHERFYHSSARVRHDEMAHLMRMLHQQSITQQSYSWFNITQAVAMIVTFVVQNFAL